MTDMARRRPIASHPAFAPVIALWFAALLGATVAVLPAAVLERGLAVAGLDGLVPLTFAIRTALSGLAAVIGALLGYPLARSFARRTGEDPRPLYAEAGPPLEDDLAEPTVRRPLSVREELAEDFDEDREPVSTAYDDAGSVASQSQAHEGFMILTPQPIHPPLPAPDLDVLLEQFDTAFESYRDSGSARTAAPPRADPVQAFVAQQTAGASAIAGSAAASPLGGLVPDHQAELRAALDKLARSQRGE